MQDTTGWSQYANVTKMRDDEKSLVSEAKIPRTMGYLRDSVTVDNYCSIAGR